MAVEGYQSNWDVGHERHSAEQVRDTSSPDTYVTIVLRTPPRGTQLEPQGHPIGGGGGAGEYTPAGPIYCFGVSPEVLCQRAEQPSERQSSV